MNLKQIGINVQNARRTANLTQAGLAETINKSTNHIAHIESGSVKMSLDCLLDICHATHSTPNDILMGLYDFTPENSLEADPLLREAAPYINSEDQMLLQQISRLLAQRKQP